jgi:threonine synthase
VLELAEKPTATPAAWEEGVDGVWRYRQGLPLVDGVAPISLGEGSTPLVSTLWNGEDAWLKLEYLNPTGSFKDRGATVLVSALKAASVSRVVDDSSGNAGAALAAYAGRGGLDAAVYVPAHTAAAKRAQIAVYGAEIVLVPGPRVETAMAVREAVRDDVAYASHVYSPLYAEGTKTAAFEIYEQFGRQGPESVVVPVGHGSMLLGLFRGFGELLDLGLIDELPRMFGVQAAPCAPLVRAWRSASSGVEAVEEGETVAEGVRIAEPVRGEAILEAVRESGGAMLAIEDAETVNAQKRLARQGFYVEPTSALAPAALDHLSGQLGRRPVVILTGSGLKGGAH